MQKLKIHLIAYYSNAASLWKGVPTLLCHIQNMSNASELRQAVIEYTSTEIHRDCGITVRSRGKWFCPMSNKNLIEIELFIKMLYSGFMESGLQPDHETNKPLRRMQVSPPARNDDRSPIWNIWRPLISFLLSTKDFLILKGRLTDRFESTTALSILNGPKYFFLTSRLIAEVN